MTEEREQYEMDLVLEQTIAALSEPFPPEAHEIKEVKNNKTGKVARMTFVSWHHYVRRLNGVTPDWSMGETVIREVGGKLIMGVPLTICGVTRVNFGDEETDCDMFGTAATNAFAQAFKRSCAMFGLGLYLYDGGGVPSRKPERKAEPKPAQKSVQRGGNGKSNRPVVRTGRWQGAAFWVVEKVGHYVDKDGNPNIYNMLGAVGQMGYTEITDENVEEIAQALVDRVKKEA